MARKAFSLVEFAFAQSGMVERNGHDEIPFGCSQRRHGAAKEQISKEWLKAKGAVVFVAVDDVQNTFARDDCRTGEAEI
jgi:hypothetical protein